MSMWEECKELQNDLVKMRRDLHQIPELGKILPRTQEYILNELEKLGCDAIQGYFYSEPLSFNDYQAFLKENKFEKRGDNR